MPIFDFYCDKCDMTYEGFVKKHDDKKSCPVCGQTKVQKLLGSPMVRVYDTDLASKQKDLSTYIYGA